MLKVFGLLLLMTVSTGVGIYFSKMLIKRKKRLGEMLLFVTSAAEWIRSGTEVGEIISKEGAKAGVFEDEIGIKTDFDGFAKRDTEIIRDFFSAFGMGDTESQVKRCKTYAGLLELQLAEAERQVKQKSGLYGKMGFLAGLFAVIILI